ncbi:TPA: fimbria/pilus periplasmic chaperone [Aeromonas bestiarum]|nr:fimbria/pilus periplasmic chaperone [Aeromonas bestiarum]HEH9406983.1 fimbria/pilus periplasmic chaperone [Aeromonas bestiarum]
MFLYLFAATAHADNASLSQQNQAFSVTLGASRIIYAPGSKGQIVAVLNEQDYPMLVQTQVTAEDNKGANAPSGRFSAVPPLFRLDAQQRAKVRIVQTGGEFPADRESLYWVCVKGIPPSGDDSWADDQAPDRATLMVQTLLNNCIKLLVRPKALEGQNALVMAEQLSWRLDPKGLTAMNPTPFYINLSALTVGGKAVASVRHIAPFASHTFALPAGASGEVQWRALSDLGGEGPLLRAPLP